MKRKKIIAAEAEKEEATQEAKKAEITAQNKKQYKSINNNKQSKRSIIIDELLATFFYVAFLCSRFNIIVVIILTYVKVSILTNKE